MTEYTFAEAKPYHVGQILRRMRGVERDALTSIGLDLHRELRYVFQESYSRVAWFIDGKLAGIGGYMGMMASSSTHLWLVLSEYAVTHHAKMIAREGRRVVDDAMKMHREVTTTVPVGDAAAMRYARYCGFETRHPEVPNGLITLWRRNVSFQSPVKRRDEAARSPAPFMIFTAGRSRTTWLSALLTYADWACYHEIAVHFRSMEQVAGFFRNPKLGTAETAAAPGWRLLRHYIPEMKFVVVRRPVDEIVSSMMTMEGAKFDEERLRKRISYEDRILGQIAEQPGTLSVRFSDLEDEAVCAALFEHCLPYWFDPEWWEHIRVQNIQTNAADLFGYYFSHVEEISNFKRHCKTELRRLAREGVFHDGMI